MKVRDKTVPRHKDIIDRLKRVEQDEQIRTAIQSKSATEYLRN